MPSSHSASIMNRKGRKGVVSSWIQLRCHLATRCLLICIGLLNTWCPLLCTRCAIYLSVLLCNLCILIPSTQESGCTEFTIIEVLLCNPCILSSPARSTLLQVTIITTSVSMIVLRHHQVQHAFLFRLFSATTIPSCIVLCIRQVQHMLRFNYVQFATIPTSSCWRQEEDDKT